MVFLAIFSHRAGDLFMHALVHFWDLFFYFAAPIRSLGLGVGDAAVGRLEVR